MVTVLTIFQYQGRVDHPCLTCTEAPLHQQPAAMRVAGLHGLTIRLFYTVLQELRG